MQINRTTTASARSQSKANAAAAVSIPVDNLTDGERQEIAHNIGYRKIGKPVPKDVTLSQIVKTLPSEVSLPPCHAHCGLTQSVMDSADMVTHTDHDVTLNISWFGDKIDMPFDNNQTTACG